MIGIWTNKFGYASPCCRTRARSALTPSPLPSFHNVWEFWAYNVVFGLFQAPYYAFSQTMMAELTPPGFDNMVRPSPPARVSDPPSSPLAPPCSCSSSGSSGFRTARRR